MGEYKKITKEDIDMPRYCLFFIESIQEELDKTDFEEYWELELEIKTSEFPYCYEALELVVKTFERKGFTLRVPTYKTIKDENGKKIWAYKWVVQIIKDYDDLPF